MSTAAMRRKDRLVPSGKHHKAASTSTQRGGYCPPPGMSRGLLHPSLKKKVMAGKADRLYAAGIRTDDDAVKPEEVKAPRRRGPQKQYELSSYACGNFSEDYYNKEEPQALQTGPNTDCRADCGDGAATVATQAVEADPTCPHARAQACVAVVLFLSLTPSDCSMLKCEKIAKEGGVQSL